MAEVDERPRLRPYLAAERDHRDPRYVFVSDRLGLSDGRRRMTLQEFAWVQRFDGKHSLRDMQTAAMRETGGVLVPLEIFARLLEMLDEALFLDGPRFREKLAEPIRQPSCLGCYESDLRGQLHRLFTDRRGPGMPGEPSSNGRLRAALIPHIDYYRGGVTYAWGFKEVLEQADASLFVIIGTSHYSSERFTLTRKNFKTPLGIVPTDQQYIDRLVAHNGDGLFDDEIWAHLPEHSIELEVVFLQYLYEKRRPIRIVPLVVGSFHDCVEEGLAPSRADDIGRMISALQNAEAETSEPICYIISGDLAHIGPKFGDPDPVAEPILEHSRKQDELLMKQAEAANMGGYFEVIAAETDSRRICGLPPTYTLLEAIGPASGKLLHYDQYVHPQGFESVSFASMGFYR
jgi:AmmeMemoRadiSam system protein B